MMHNPCVSEFLGALHRIGVFTRQETHVMIYDDTLVVAVDDNAAVVLAAAIGLGLTSRINERIRKKGEALTPEELAAERGNEVIPIDTVARATLRKAAGGLYRSLDLELADGTMATLKWQRGDNKDDTSIPMLRKALGDKLEVAFDHEAAAAEGIEAPEPS